MQDDFDRMATLADASGLPWTKQCMVLIQQALDLPDNRRKLAALHRQQQWQGPKAQPPTPSDDKRTERALLYTRLLERDPGNPELRSFVKQMLEELAD